MKYDNTKYDNTPDDYDYIIETTKGMYPVGEWGYCTCRKTLEEAQEFCRIFNSRRGSSDGYRVVDRNGNIILDP